MTRLRNRLVEQPGSIGSRMRARRFDDFLRMFPRLSDMVVLDLGGRAETWRRAPVHPASVTLVNFEQFDGDDESWLKHVPGDACDLPPAARHRYDIVFSNSVIEHVGGFVSRQAFAATVHDHADRHWIQTPYRYFPIEPHWLFPGMQFLPVSVRASIATRWPLAHSRARPEESVAAVLMTELLSKTEILELFPESNVRFERVGGLPKSIIASKN